MTHDGIIHCGGVGPVIAEKTITITDHEGLNLAVHLKHRNESNKDFEKKKDKLAELVQKMYEVAKEPGDEIHDYPKD
jgi:hypothetical protein